MAQAVGILEVYGLVAAFVAGDAGCKAANVTLEPFDRNKPGHPETLKVPLLVVVKFRGSVSEVTAAVEAAEKACQLPFRRGLQIYYPQPEEGTNKMLRLNGTG